MLKVKEELRSRTAKVSGIKKKSIFIWARVMVMT